MIMDYWVKWAAMSEQTSPSINLFSIILWLIAALFFLYEFFLRTFLGALGHQIIPALHLTPSQFAFLASVFYIAYGTMQVPVGGVVDKIGIRLTLLSATIICALSAFLFASTHSYALALVARFCMGFGGAFAFLCLLIITLERFPQKYFALFVGLGQFIGTLGALLAGGPLATVISEYNINWRLVFMCIGGFGIFLFLLTLAFVRNTVRQRQKQKIFLEHKETFLQKIKKFHSSPQAWLVAVYSAFVFLSVAMLGAVWGTLFLQSLGFSQAKAASIVSLGWLGFACGCPLLGALSDILSQRRIIMIGCAAVGFVLIIFVVYVHMQHTWVYSLLFFILGITSAGQSIGFAIITEHVEPNLKSLALGLNSAFITLLAAITPLIVSFIIEYTSGKHTAPQHYTPSSFTYAFLLMPTLYLLALILSSCFIKETYCRSIKERIILKPNQ